MRRLLLPLVFISIASGIALAQTYSISTAAGADRLRDGYPATTAPLRSARVVLADGQGNFYVSDRDDHRVRKVNASGTISTFAGTGIGVYSGDGGSAANAGIVGVTGMAVDSSGNVYLADYDDNRVRMVSPGGIITTVAGNGNWQYAGDGGQATAAQVGPAGIAISSAGNLYIADYDNCRIRIVNTSGVISTFAGTGTCGYNRDGSQATTANIDVPTSVAVDSSSIVYFTDYQNNRIRKVAPGGIISTFAGNGSYQFSGDNGPATAAAFDPIGIAVDSAGNLYIADQYNGRVRKIDISTARITTVAGSGGYGLGGDGGAATAAALAGPASVSLDQQGGLFIADLDNGRVRKVSGGLISTVAGTTAGDGGMATSAFLSHPTGVALDLQGNFYVADTEQHRIRMVSPSGAISTVAGIGLAGYNADNIAAGSAQLNGPNGVAVDAAGNIYIADSLNYLIRKVTTDGVIHTFAGTGVEDLTGDGGQATSARIGYTTSVIVDSAGTVYFNDLSSYRVRRVTSGGVISTIAGNGNTAYAGDGGLATQTALVPYGLAKDAAGNLYVADYSNNRIRKIDSAGRISTYAGNGSGGFGGDGGQATSAALFAPSDVAIDAAGNLLIADYGNEGVRMVSPAGIISTIAGNGGAFYAGDGGPALAAQLDPFAVRAAADGSILVVDWLNDRVRKLSPQVVTTVALVSGSGQGGTVGAPLAAPLVVTVRDAAGIPMPGVTVAFAVTAGAATLNPATMLTGLDGTAQTQVTFGASAGAVTVTATVAGMPPVVFNLTSIPVLPAARINSGGVVGSGLSIPAVRALSANAIAAAFGDGFAPAGTYKQVTATDLVNGRIPTNLFGTCVLVGDTPAPVFFVYAGQLSQINFQVPQLPASGTVEVRVVTNCGTSNEVRSAPEIVTVQTVTPEFFYFQLDASGSNPVAGYNAATYVFIGTPGLLPGATFAPARPGDLLTLFLTGLGPTSPSFAPGMLPDSVAWITNAYQVTIGGIVLAPSDIQYVGVAPTLAGAYQLNVRVPDSVLSGNQPIIISVNGVPSSSGGYITVQR